jgi:hypothetical protein
VVKGIPVMAMVLPPSSGPVWNEGRVIRHRQAGRRAGLRGSGPRPALPDIIKPDIDPFVKAGRDPMPGVREDKNHGGKAVDDGFQGRRSARGEGCR